MIWRHIPLIALAMMATIVLHDVAMAGEPHTSIRDTITQSSTHHASAHHPGTTGDAETPAPEHPVRSFDCLIFPGVRPNIAVDIEPGEAATTMLLTTETSETDRFVAHPRIAPDHPPAVRRALLQVYLN